MYVARKSIPYLLCSKPSTFFSNCSSAYTLDTVSYALLMEPCIDKHFADILCDVILFFYTDADYTGSGIFINNRGEYICMYVTKDTLWWRL